MGRLPATEDLPLETMSQLTKKPVAGKTFRVPDKPAAQRRDDLARPVRGRYETPLLDASVEQVARILRAEGTRYLGPAGGVLGTGGKNLRVAWRR